ncbi:RDD family protein [Fibrella sp. HMF5335]|uniref:RDD family protein n=1 Tax=Fibrella rubiginis TaxID=2817060 RepID=A0A939K5K0_9BACT|nr:RDD family protein [Fibrella rubiginis]MBO0936550.1 RDD family protein [Fibrella rubiginis]
MSIAIKTSQNVLLEYEPASIGDRILATIIDYFVFAAWLVLTIALPTGTGMLGGNSPMSIVYYSVVVALPILFYDFLCEWLLNGQSIGKIAMKIKVVMLDGSQPGIGAYLLRWLLRLIDMRIMSGIVAVISIAATGKGQRLGDLAAGTTVIRLKPKVQLNEVTYSSLPANYTVSFPDVQQLSDQDIQVVREVLQRGTTDAALRTADKIKEVLSITTSLGSYEFLNTIVNDYQYLSMQE